MASLEQPTFRPEQISGWEPFSAVLTNLNYSFKAVLNEGGIAFFPTAIQHRDMKVYGLSYEDDYKGNALAAMLSPNRVEIRYHAGFTDIRVAGPPKMSDTPQLREFARSCEWLYQGRCIKGSPALNHQLRHHSEHGINKNCTPSTPLHDGARPYQRYCGARAFQDEHKSHRSELFCRRDKVIHKVRMESHHMFKHRAVMFRFRHGGPNTLPQEPKISVPPLNQLLHIMSGLTRACSGAGGRSNGKYRYCYAI